ncbi:hypothetical protein BJ741DRAFT_617428 [Chytriomyces cf. hyalinus JEL632]|nr:hypothetical protein BJ741DRAFT_617428 [Chytriomyces cf. hyalinus JEL632]
MQNANSNWSTSSNSGSSSGGGSGSANTNAGATASTAGSTATSTSSKKEDKNALSSRSSWSNPAVAAVANSSLRRKLSWNVNASTVSEGHSLSTRRSIIGGFLGFLSGNTSASNDRVADRRGGGGRAQSASVSVSTVSAMAQSSISVETLVPENKSGKEVEMLETAQPVQFNHSDAVSINSHSSFSNCNSSSNISNAVNEPEKKKKEFHTIAWSVSSELGYRNMLSTSAHPTASNLVQTDFIRIPIHTQIEDIHWPAKEDRRMWASNGLGGDHRVYGHHFNDGGVVTSEYDSTWEKENNAAKSVAGASMDIHTDDFAAVSGQYDIISESGSIASSDDEIDLSSPRDRKQKHQFEDSNDLMDLVTSANEYLRQTDPMIVESHVTGTNNLSSAASAMDSSDTESTLSSTNNSSSLQRDDQAATPSQSDQSAHLIPTTESSRLFILADGHGGILASKFFVPRTKSVLTDILQSQKWDFSQDQHRNDFEAAAVDAFRVIDAEYCATQVARYRTWVDNGSVPSDRPDDDGCTLVAVVLHDGWLVNMNVGDSRMTLASRARKTSPSQKHQESWTRVFTSVDHNMTHPGKVYSIHSAGGHFMSPNHSLMAINPQHPSVRKDVPYDELNLARIYRHASPAVKAVGVSHRRTLNLTGTMGDLLFKIEPAVLNPVPDVSFVELDASREYVMVLATDGIWDHLMEQSGDTERQNSMVMRVVASAIETVEADRDANVKEWELYNEAKAAWRKAESTRRRALKQQKREAKRLALNAGAARAAEMIMDDEVIGGHGMQGDVAVAAENDFQSSPVALNFAPRIAAFTNTDAEALHSEISDFAVSDSASIASSNGSTAVASKERSLDKKNDMADDEIQPDESHPDDGPSSKRTEEREDALEDVQFQDSDVAERSSRLSADKGKMVSTSMVLSDAHTSTDVPGLKTIAIPPPTKPAFFDFHEALEARLKQVTDILAEREMGRSAEGRIHPNIVKTMQHLYWQRQVRYDDATAFVAFFG